MSWLLSNIVLVQATVTSFLLALSLQFPMRMGVFSFAGMGLYGVGGYTAGIAVTRYQWETWPAIGLAVLLAGVVGLLIGLVVHRLNGLYLAMATVSFVLIVGVIAGNGGTFTGGHTGLYGALGRIEHWHLVVVVVGAMALFTLTERGGFARRVEAVREDHALAASMGIDVTRYRLLAFLVSGLVGGLAGALNVLLRTTVTPEAIGFSLVVLALSIVVVGGWRSWVGVFIGAVIFSWLPLLLAIAGEWRGVLYGLVVVLAAIFFPTGIWGGLAALAQRIARRRREVAPMAPTGREAAILEPSSTVAATLPEISVREESR